MAAGCLDRRHRRGRDAIRLGGAGVGEAAGSFVRAEAGLLVRAGDVKGMAAAIRALQDPGPGTRSAGRRARDVSRSTGSNASLSATRPFWPGSRSVVGERRRMSLRILLDINHPSQAHVICAIYEACGGRAELAVVARDKDVTLSPAGFRRSFACLSTPRPGRLGSASEPFSATALLSSRPPVPPSRPARHQRPRGPCFPALLAAVRHPQRGTMRRWCRSSPGSPTRGAPHRHPGLPEARSLGESAPDVSGHAEASTFIAIDSRPTLALPSEAGSVVTLASSAFGSHRAS